MMKRCTRGLFLSVLLTASAACNQSTPNVDHPAETVQSSTAPSSAVPAANRVVSPRPSAIVPPLAPSPTVAPPVVRADVMTDLAPAHTLPVSVSVRSPLSVSRTPQGDWLVRANVRIVNEAPTPAMAERVLLTATVAETPLVLEHDGQGLDEEMPLVTGQAAQGEIVWRVPAGVASPTHVLISYGMPGARVSADIAAE